MLLRTSRFPRDKVPVLFMNTPWLGATVAYAAEGLEEEGGGMKTLVGEEESAAIEEEGVGGSVCRAWLNWLMIGLDMTTTLLFTIGFPIVTLAGLSG